MGLWTKFLNRSKRKEIKKLPKIHRDTRKLQDRYPNYTFGMGTYGMPKVHDWNEGSTLKVGAFTSIAGNVDIFLGGHHRTDWISCYPFPVYMEEAAHIEDFGGTNGDVIIGNDSWICSNVTILSGVTIGDGAIVAAGSIVTKDVEPYSIVAGNPARHIKWRFDEDTIDTLLKSKWWTWPEAEIRKISPLLCSNDIKAFKEYCQNRQKEDLSPSSSHTGKS